MKSTINPEQKKTRTSKRLVRLGWVVVILLFLGSIGYNIWMGVAATNLRAGQKIAVGGYKIVKPVDTIERGYVDGNGNLNFVYTDGTTVNVGHVVGKDAVALGPTDTQIAEAVSSYCSDGQCDGKLPTPEQVAAAVTQYCSNGSCLGAPGQNATASQVMAAVAQYCGTGACTGPQGATGAAGPNGLSTSMACVIRMTNNIKTQYVAWKYTIEPSSAYRDLYKLPVWAQGSNCVDLTGAA